MSGRPAPRGIAPDEVLRKMLGELAAMPAADRAKVLDGLGPSERQKLMPLLNAADASGASPALAALIDVVWRNQQVPGMTAAGARALRAAAATLAPAEPLKTAESRRPSGRLVDRLWAGLGR